MKTSISYCKMVIVAIVVCEVMRILVGVCEGGGGGGLKRNFLTLYIPTSHLNRSGWLGGWVGMVKRVGMVALAF